MMNVFDILGPVMIGPSSSHTAGAARIGRITRALLGAPAVHASILLHGSFAKTYRGHGTDKALIAGIMGMNTDDERIRFAPDLAVKEGLEVEITTGEIDGAHPNTALITQQPHSQSSGKQHRRWKYSCDKSQRHGCFDYRPVHNPDRPPPRRSRNDRFRNRGSGTNRCQYLQFPSFPQ